MRILKDICDEPDSDFCWNRQQAGKISVYNAHVAPLWDYIRAIGFEAALLECAMNSHAWQKEVAMCLSKIESLAESIGHRGIMLVCDDLGSAHGSMISARTYQQSYAPFMDEYVAICRHHRLIPAWHSCGNLLDLVFPISESGIPLLWLDEIHLMGAANVRRNLQPWQRLWFHPRSMHDLLDAQPAWAIYNITASELRGGVEEQKAEFRRIVQEAEHGR